MVSEGVPDHEVGVVDAAVSLGVSREAGPAGVLVGVITGGAHLGRVVGRYPEGPGHEPRPLDHRRIGVGKGQHVLSRHQLVGSLLTQVVGLRFAGYEPVPGRVGIDVTLRLRLGLQVSLLSVEGVVVGIVLVGGRGVAVHFVNRVLPPIDGHVHPDVEEVLVDVGRQLGGDERPVGGHVARRHGGVVHHPGQLHLVFDCAVLVEIPEEPVFVVPDGRDEGDHQPSGPAHFRLPGPPVDVLPEDAEVLFVHADGVGDFHDASLGVIGHGVEIVDLAEAVAPEGKGVGQVADAVLSRVEGILAKVGCIGLAVGDHHLGQTGPVDYGASAPLVPIRYVVEHEPLPGRKPEAHVPLLPGNVPAVHGEAGALRLGDVDGLQVLSELVDEVLRVVAVIRGQWDDAVIYDAKDFHLVEVYHGDDPLDGTGVAVVVGAGAEPAEGIGQPHPLFALDPVIPRRPRVHHHQVNVGNAALRQGLLERRIFLYGLLTFVEFVQHDLGLDAGDVLPRLHGVLGEGDYGLVGASGVVVQEADEGLPGQGARPVVGQDVVLVGLVEHHGLVPHPRPDVLLPVEYLHGAEYFVSREGIEGVSGWGPGLGCSRGVLQSGHGYLPARLNSGDVPVYMPADYAFNREWGGDVCVAAPLGPAETCKPSSVSASSGRRPSI